MAEQEITKHTKKILKVTTDPQQKLERKTGGNNH